MTPMSALRRRVGALLAVCVVGVGLAGARECAAQPCRAQWEGGFTRQEPEGSISFLLPHSDGTTTGPSLFAFGGFTEIARLPGPNTPALHAARWDGRDWSQVGSGLSGAPKAALVWDDGLGGGPAIYVGGLFTAPDGRPHALARWTGGAWEYLGGQVGGTGALSLAVWDDGLGEALYVAGSFTTTGSVLRNLLKWDGVNWSAPWGSALFHGVVTTLAAVQTGPLAGLYAGGDMYQFNGAALGRLAKWDGATWSRLGEGTFFARPTRLAVFDPGAGESLFVSGPFTNVAGVPVDELARWDGTAWHDVDRSLPREPFTVFDDGAGEALWFFSESSAPTRWDGQSATTVGDPTIGVYSLARFDTGGGGGGERTYAGLDRGSVLTETVGKFGALSGNAWERVDTGPWTSFAFLGAVDLGDGAQTLIGAAQSANQSGSPPAELFRLSNGRWLSMGELPEARRTVRSILRFDRGLAPGAAGVCFGLAPASSFPSSSAPVGQFNGVARWNGVAWSALGTGLTNVEFSGAEGTGAVSSMLVHDDGAGGGPQLYVCGTFNRIEGQPTTSSIARWDGAAWSSVGDGPGGRVRDMTIYDDGSGPALFASGQFQRAGDPFAFIPLARWDGVTWTHLWPPEASLSLAGAITPFDDGVGGGARLIQSVSMSRILAWDGLDWTRIGAVGTTPVGQPAQFLSPPPAPGDHPLLFARTESSPISISGVFRSFAVWDGRRWTIPDTDIDGPINQRIVRTATVFDDGSGPCIWVAGSFASVGGQRTHNVGRLRACDTTCEGDSNFDGVVDMLDLNDVLASYGAVTSGGSSVARPLLPGDLNLDGKVDFLDLNILLGRFGSGC